MRMVISLSREIFTYLGASPITLEGVNRCLYAFTPRPPATIEYI